MKIGAKSNSTSERDRSAASSGARTDEHVSQPRGKLGDAGPASGHANRAAIGFLTPEGPDTATVEHLAYRFWEERGRPDGSPEEDWFRAETQLRKDMDR